MSQFSLPELDLFAAPPTHLPQYLAWFSHTEDWMPSWWSGTNGAASICFPLLRPKSFRKCTNACSLFVAMVFLPPGGSPHQSAVNFSAGAYSRCPSIPATSKARVLHNWVHPCIMHGDFLMSALTQSFPCPVMMDFYLNAVS